MTEIRPAAVVLTGPTKAALVSYDGASASFTATSSANAVVSAQDITYCLSGNCSGQARAAHDDVGGSRNHSSSKTLTWSPTPASASAYKQISLY